MACHRAASGTVLMLRLALVLAGTSCGTDVAHCATAARTAMSVVAVQMPAGLQRGQLEELGQLHHVPMRLLCRVRHSPSAGQYLLRACFSARADLAYAAIRLRVCYATRGTDT
eukprot:3491052-Rhodomonas_salina.1